MLHLHGPHATAKCVVARYGVVVEEKTSVRRSAKPLDGRREHRFHGVGVEVSRQPTCNDDARLTRCARVCYFAGWLLHIGGSIQLRCLDDSLE